MIEMIEIVQSLRADGVILQSAIIPADLKTQNLASEDRKELALIFIAAAHRLLDNVPTKIESLALKYDEACEAADKSYSENAARDIADNIADVKENLTMNTTIYEKIAIDARKMRSDIEAIDVDIFSSDGAVIRRKGDSAKTIEELDGIIALAEAQHQMFNSERYDGKDWSATPIHSTPVVPGIGPILHAEVINGVVCATRSDGDSDVTWRLVDGEWVNEDKPAV